MDYTEDTRTFNAVEFCAGYAGIHLGLSRAISNLRLVALCEIEAFACANLVAKMEAGLLDSAPIWTDLKTFPGRSFHGKVDLLVAGYPCQPFSAAGKRAGADDPRHLWPYVREQIQLMQPRFCFFENVDGHISMGLREVLADLRALGYCVENERGEPSWGVFSAAEVGAPHQRKRVFILAHRSGEGLQGGERSRATRAQGQPCGHTAERDECVELAYGDNSGSGENQLCSEFRATGPKQPPGGVWVHCDPRAASEVPLWPSRPGEESLFTAEAPLWPSRPGERQHCWEPPRVCRQTDLGNDWCRTANRHGEVGHTKADCERRSVQPGHNGEGIEDRGSGRLAGTEAQPPLGRDPHGSADRLDAALLHHATDNRVDELRLLGNGVVPATAELAWRVLYRELMSDVLSS